MNCRIKGESGSTNSRHAVEGRYLLNLPLNVSSEGESGSTTLTCVTNFFAVTVKGPLKLGCNLYAKYTYYPTLILLNKWVIYQFVYQTIDIVQNLCAN